MPSATGSASRRRLYVFLRTGRRSSLSNITWPAPAHGRPGAWVGADAGGSPGPIRASTSDELLWSLDDELWEVELEGDVHRVGRSFVAARGRLLRRIQSWTPEVATELVHACAERLRDAAVAELGGSGRPAEAERLAAAGSLETIEQVGLVIAAGGTDAAARLAGFTADAALYARDAPDPARAAAVAAYVAAHALAGGDPSLASYEARFEGERRWQAVWLERRLRL